MVYVWREYCLGVSVRKEKMNVKGIPLLGAWKMNICNIESFVSE